MICYCIIGNDGAQRSDAVEYPAKYPFVISVGACNRHGRRAELSPEGDKIDFLCPGERVTSTCSIYANRTHSVSIFTFRFSCASRISRGGRRLPTQALFGRDPLDPPMQYIGGSTYKILRCTPLLLDPILSFTHTFSPKSTCVGGPRPLPNGSTSPYQKCWIRPCNCY